MPTITTSGETTFVSTVLLSYLMTKTVNVCEETLTLLEWPSETVSIEWNADFDVPRTIIFFVPGNPGLVHWYIPMLVSLVKRLGVGYSAYAASHAGHSTKPECLASDGMLEATSTASASLDHGL